MLAIRRVCLLVAAVCLVAGSVEAQVIKIFKHDQFSEDIATASSEISGIPLAVQPGWANGEAYGQVYRPEPADYPIKILGIDMVMAGPPNMSPPAEADAEIEFWEFVGAGPDPGTASPIWSVHTSELFDPIGGTFGIPLTGDVGWTVDFDWDEPLNHPPMIYSGDIAVVIRFTDDPRDMQTEWGTAGCIFFPSLGACGCQEVATLHDQATTLGANLMHIITPLGTCEGSAGAWMFIEDAGVTGDIILRMRAEVAGCTPSCVGLDCGDDGCGGSCGDCILPETCDLSGQCICIADCDGIECGDDGCDGSCGDCIAPETCDILGQCVCVADCDGLDCGDDGCGGSCGDCTLPETCDISGLCTCTRDCAGKACGDDGCGGSCGSCTAPATCNASGQCECLADCSGRCCGADGCGSTCPDACDASQYCNQANCTCVTGCSANSECEYLGLNYYCDLISHECRCDTQCSGKCCGDDGCGGTCPDDCAVGDECNQVSCLCEPTGGCTDNDVRCNNDVIETCLGGVWQAGVDCTATGQTCLNGACQGGCTPNCAGKECGDDGCQGNCGICQAGENCINDLCVTGGDPLTVIAISPDFGYNDVETDVSITGTWFAPGATVKLGGTNLSAVQIVSSELISATVPAAMEPGTYMLVVANSNGDTDSIIDAFEVRLREDDGKTGGCGCSTPVSGSRALCVLLLLLPIGILVRRKS
jgi:IPT/TIG domain-containing protein